MSDPENFLSRWSRRKREAADSVEDAAVDAQRVDLERPENDDEPERRDAKTAVTKPDEAPFDIKSLPPIESITAQTDIRPFLAPGVPPELSRAALRRVWVADPKIRDFVGLQDYDWDFNTVGAIAGFGDLEMTPEVRRQIARIVGEVFAEPLAGTTEPAESTAQPAPPLEKSPPEPTLPKPVAAAITDGRQEEGRLSQALAVSRDDAARLPKEDTAVQHGSRARDHLQSTMRRGHGRALPK